MSRKFAKRGGRGRGSFGGNVQNKKGYLPEELMSHYRRVFESLRQFEDERDVATLDHSKSDFLNNVVSGLAGELTQVSQNQTVSTIVESIIAAASPANLRTLFVSATADLSTFFFDRFASHVLESLVLRLPEFFEEPTTHSSVEEEEEEDVVSQDKVVEGFERMCEFVDEQFDVLVTHTYGSHVLRALLEAMSGVSVAHELKRSQKSGHVAHSKKESPQPKQIVKPPKSFQAIFDKYSQRVFAVSDYEVHLKDSLFAVLTQAVLLILHKHDPDQCQTRCWNILHSVTQSSKEQGPSQSIPDMACDMVGSYLLEVIFRLIGGHLTRETYDSMLRGKLLHFAIHPVANHVLHAFIASVHDKGLMEQVFEELSGHLEDILAVGHFALVTHLAAGCRRVRVRQEEFITLLMEAFHCKEPADRQGSLLKLIATCTAYEVFFSSDEGKDKDAEDAESPQMLKGPVNAHGCRLIQELLQFVKPSHMALALLDLQPAELLMLCRDPSGSFVVDAFFSSSTVLEKNKDLLLKKLKGLLVDVACSKNGSRCLENIWKTLTLPQRKAVAQELSASPRLRSDPFGHFVCRNFQLGLFTASCGQWKKAQWMPWKRKRATMEEEEVEEVEKKSEAPRKRRKTEERDASQKKDDKFGDKSSTTLTKRKKGHEAQAEHDAISTQPPAKRSREEEQKQFFFSVSTELETSSLIKKKKKKKDKMEAVIDLSAKYEKDKSDKKKDKMKAARVFSAKGEKEKSKKKKDKKKAVKTLFDVVENDKADKKKAKVKALKALSETGETDQSDKKKGKKRAAKVLSTVCERDQMDVARTAKKMKVKQRERKK